MGSIVARMGYRPGLIDVSSSRRHDPTMTPAIDLETSDTTEFARMRALAAEAEALAPVDADGARERLRSLRELLTGTPAPTLHRHVAGLVRIVETLDADLVRGGVRSITGLTRQVRRLETAASRAA
jgi:hypothetical protein